MIETSKFFGWYNPVTKAGSYVTPNVHGLKYAMERTGLQVNSFEDLRTALINEGFKADFVEITHHETDGSLEIWRAVRNEIMGTV